MSSGTLIFFVAVLATVFFYSRRYSKLPLPPGPCPKLFTGNAHQLPKKEPWLTYAKWAESYGPIFSFHVPNRQFIVLSSLQSATELLDSRATIYSDRPRVWMQTELAKRNLNPFNISCTHPYFKTYRTTLKASLSSRAIQSYQSLQTEQSHILLGILHKNPEHFIEQIRTNTAAVVLNVAYGWKVTENSDYLINILKESMEMSAILAQPGRWLVDTVPLLRFLPAWFPGAGFKRVAFDLGQKLSRLDMIPFNWAKKQIHSGNYTHSFVSEQLLPEDGSTVSAQQEEITKWCSLGIYAGGVDTTTSSLSSFILAMLLYPEVQKHAQAEIDAVVGQDRFPVFDDRSKLPYIGALIQELLRWAPVAPQGIPHYAMREDVYEGYRIPKGATVIADILSMSRDKGMYPDPLEFRPERFLGPSPQLDPRKFIFGFGRRRCPGLHFGEASLYLSISCILTAFTISKALDARGEEITPPAEFESSGLLWFPKPFKCKFIPRNKDLLATFSQ
ncbi:cytochrome P450 [Suillus fuscotomentosus]|uniref:Cytochrome P450 n=1 Tax=Suillus fuscotomentosus TaxID=1912939 RepID=A0AAD4HLY8_9AGAM|nr:cytochrome P450 [Suillus fuscotomentosus]KAG1902565.1 cytochrome P450 [Suillus fuscotomentosus]